MRGKSEQAFWLAAAALLIAIVCPSGSPGQESSSSSPQISMSAAAPFAGCYELQLGRWWPWSMGEDAKLVAPPQRIELRLEHGTDGLEQNGLVIRTIPPGVTSHRKAYWRPQGKDSVDLTWTDGLTGVTLKLTKDGDELRGWAHPHFDAARLIPYVARVVARPMACGSAQ